MESRVLVIGEALVDVIHDQDDGNEREYPGGSGANAAVALARLGHSVTLVSSFAEDEYGDLIARHLAANDVGLACDPHVLERTSSAVARIGENRSATYSFDVAWVLGPMAPLGATPTVVHVTSMAAVMEPGCHDTLALVENLRGSAIISYDVNVRAEATGKGPEIVERVETLVALCDVVKASDEDLEELWPERGVEGAAAHLLGLGPAVVIITRGAEGASYLTSESIGEIESPAADVVDTVGAGDTFSAAIIDALVERDLATADRRDALTEAGPSIWSAVLRWAAQAAAVTVSRPGADPPHRHEIN